jgi:NADH-dependent peroxiredoxin subunit F
MYDLIIIGGGPAGSSAGVYAARKKLKTLFLTFDFGGQSVVSADIQNWIGTTSISGDQLAKDLKEHVLAYASDVLELKEGQRVSSIEKTDGGSASPSGGFKVTTEKGEAFNGKTIFIATGADRRKLKVPGAEEFENKGITYCASCDGPLFADQDVVVIGGGNAGFETAAQLLAYTKSVTLLHRNPEFKADQITVEKVLKNPKMKAITNAETVEVRGDKFVTTLVYKDNESNENHEIQTTGVFVEIGLVPATSYLGNLLEMTDYKQIVVDPKNQRTSVDGIWSAGDCSSGLFHQNNIAAGDAVKALEDIYNYLNAR